jgi:dephospho-CoA kinase
MKLSFSEYVYKKEYESRVPLEEKLILYNNGAKYGQVVFLAGGAGSGKGFAISNFMQGEDFKIRDVDELKIAFQKLDDLGKFTMDALLKKYGSNISERDMDLIQKNVIDKGYSLKDLNLKTPEHVYALHVMVRASGVKNKTLDLLLDGAAQNTLPNILIDSTFADMDDMTGYIPKLIKAGYTTRNIHVTWVLTNYEIAIQNNKKRARVVPEDILLKTHRGAAQTVFALFKKGFPKEVDGGVYVVLNNPQNTMFIVDPKTGQHYKDIKGNKVVGNFMYLTLKKPGKSMTNDAGVRKELYNWIVNNVPPDSLDTKELDDL